MPYFIAFAPLGIPECPILLRLRVLRSANAWIYCVCRGDSSRKMPKPTALIGKAWLQFPPKRNFQIPFPNFTSSK